MCYCTVDNNGLSFHIALYSFYAPQSGPLFSLRHQCVTGCAYGRNARNVLVNSDIVFFI